MCPRNDLWVLSRNVLWSLMQRLHLGSNGEAIHFNGLFGDVLDYYPCPARIVR